MDFWEEHNRSVQPSGNEINVKAVSNVIVALPHWRLGWFRHNGRREAWAVPPTNCWVSFNHTTGLENWKSPACGK